MKYSPAILLTLALATSFSIAAESADDEAIQLMAFDEKRIDASSVSYELTRTFMSKEEWREQVDTLRQHYHDWQKDNDGADIGRYLNDRLILVALGAVGGEIEKIKRGIVWLAFYKEFNQQVPRIVSAAVLSHRESLTRLFSNFSWERASSYVKNKEWRSDTDKKSKSAREENEKDKGS